MFGKKPANWLELDSTREYIGYYQDFQMSGNLTFEEFLGSVMHSRRGNSGGTWLHPNLAVEFSRWLNPSFGFWCDQQIKHILLNERQKIEDWNVARNKTKSANKFRNAQVDVFEGRSKANFYKYSTEIWFIVGGSWKDKILRNELTAQELEILQDIERCQALLIELQQDWEELDHNFKRRDILINRVNRLRAEAGMGPIDHGVFWAKAKREYAKKKLLAEYRVG